MGSSSSCHALPCFLMSPLPAWRERLLLEVGKDPLSVTRDFPRTPVFISTGSRNNYCDSASDAEAPTCSEALFAARSRRMATAVGLLVELCREADAFGGGAVWGEAAGGGADPSAALLDALLASGMMRRKAIERPQQQQQQQAQAQAQRQFGGEGNGYGATDRPAEVFVVQSRALRVMQYMVQSVVFFAMRSVSAAMPQDWCRHLRDVAWSVHVYGEAGDVIVVQHKLTLQLYVEKHEVQHTPMFEVHFTCSIRINMGELLRNTSAAPEMGSNAEVQAIETEVHSARVVARPNKGCYSSSLWEQRRDELAEILLENFHVVLEEVAQLHMH